MRYYPRFAKNNVVLEEHELVKDLIARLQDRIDAKSLLTHPFYQAWQAGELSLEDLKDYASQYYFFEANFPQYLSAIHSNCPDREVRQGILDNLWDEEHGELNHRAMWLNFCAGLGLDPVEVEFHLAEVDSSRVEVGDLVEVRVAPFPDEVFEATVSVIAPTIDVSTRTLRVKALIPNPEGRLRPGLFARADLGVAVRKGVPMVPNEAVLQRADGAVVFVLQGTDHVRRVNVVTGVHRNHRIEIRKGLEPGLSVVVRGQSDLIDGGVVSVRNNDGTPAHVASQ